MSWKKALLLLAFSWTSFRSGAVWALGSGQEDRSEVHTEDGRPQVWLFISLTEAEPLPLACGSEPNISQCFSGQFHAMFDKFNFDVRVEKARAENLWRAFQSPRTVGIFWLGHGSAGANLLPGSAFVPDLDGMNVLPLFSKMPEQVRYFALMGCYASEALANSENKIPATPFRKIYATEDISEAQTSLTRALTDSYLYFTFALQNGYMNLSESQNVKMKPESSFQIVIERVSEPDGSAAVSSVVRARSGMQDYILGFINSRDSAQAIEVDLTLFKDGKIPTRIRIDSLRSLSALGSQHLSEFRIHSLDMKKTWSLFRQKDGNPMAVTANTYILKDQGAP